MNVVKEEFDGILFAFVVMSYMRTLHAMILTGRLNMKENVMPFVKNILSKMHKCLNKC